MFPVHQPRPSPPRSARRIVPLLTSTVEKPPLLLTSRRPFPEGRTDLSSPRDCSSPSSATQVSLSLSSIRSPVSGSSARDVSALARANEVVLALNRCCDFALVWSSEEINTFLCICVRNLPLQMQRFRCLGLRCQVQYKILHFLNNINMCTT